MTGTINKQMKKKILEIHSEWLIQNGYKKEYRTCLKQIKKLKRTGVHIMPRAIPCTSSSDPRYGRGSLGAFALLVVGALNLGGLL